MSNPDVGYRDLAVGSVLGDWLVGAATARGLVCAATACRLVGAATACGLVCRNCVRGAGQEGLGSGLGSGLVIVCGRVYRNCMRAGQEGLGPGLGSSLRYGYGCGWALGAGSCALDVGVSCGWCARDCVRDVDRGR